MGKGQEHFSFSITPSRIGMFLGDEEVGFVHYGFDEDRGVGEVDFIKIYDPFRGRGYGHTLATKVVEMAKEVGVGRLLMLIINPLTARILRKYGRFFLASMSGNTLKQEVGKEYFEEACPGAYRGEDYELWTALILHSDRAE